MSCRSFAALFFSLAALAPAVQPSKMSRRLPPAYRLHNELAYVGKTIKASKRRVTWKFAFAGDQDEHSVVLLHTINSGKKVVFLNGNEIFEDDKVR